MDYEKLFQFFFSDGESIPVDVQKNYREAFELQYKQKPETSKKKFITYVFALNDAAIVDILKQYQNNSNTYNAKVFLSNKDKTCENVDNVNTSRVTPLADDKSLSNVIYSLSLGHERSIKEAETLQAKYQSAEVKFRHSWLNLLGDIHKRECCIILEMNDETKEKINPFLSSTPLDFSETLIRRTINVKQWIVLELQQDWKTVNRSSSNDVIELDMNGWVFGRIVADNEGGLNEQSALLEILDLNKTFVFRPYEFYLNRLSSYQVFPGQIVAVQINNVQDKRLYPERLSIQQINVVNKSHLLSLQSHMEIKKKSTRLMIAAGPFCFSEGFDTTVWDKFVDSICETLPDIVLLLGPFVDSRNDIIAAGDPVIKFNHSLLQNNGTSTTILLQYTDFYRIIFNRLLSTPSLQESVTFVLVPSVFDGNEPFMLISLVCVVEHPYPVPQPTLDIDKLSFSKELTSHILLSCNPSGMVLLKYLRVAVTSCDPLSPLLTSVLTKGFSGAERLQEIHSCLLKQLSFFPTLPLSIPVNPGCFHLKPCIWTPDTLPHMLVYSCDKLPSGAKWVNGRLFLNCCKLASRRPSFLCVEIHACEKKTVESLEDFISDETVYLKK